MNFYLQTLSFKFSIGLVVILALMDGKAKSQNHSIALEANEKLLYSIRNSKARPTVHARNLYHWSIAAYDAWAAYEPSAKTYFLRDTLQGFVCPFKGVAIPSNKQAAQEKAIAFATYRLLKHRYQVSPNVGTIYNKLNNFMSSHGYNESDTSTNYLSGNPAHLGNYIAQKMIEYGKQDGANEQNNYANRYYELLNDTLNPDNTGNPALEHPNHWQPLKLTKRIDQAGNPIKSTQSALSPEWGDVDPFALQDSNKTTKTRQRNGNTYQVYLDPGPPPYIDTTAPGCLDSEYKWGFCMVSIWQSHLDPTDTTKWDVSPNGIGNTDYYPKKFSNYDTFYNYFEGGGPGIDKGYNVNPVTGQPYQSQKVKRADYARILAEYWADGIASETPPGHWFAIYNETQDDALFSKKWKGQGSQISDLEYDVKAYLTLGGAMHDAAIAAWSVKGWYDYIRPISAIRYMAEQGQCSDSTKMNYDPAGIPLIPGYIELVHQGDSLAGPNNKNVGEIKLYTWKGHDYISDPKKDTAGVGWILAGDWWSYQKPTFVTPPFPGYVSGHSTFSRAASRIMTQITGSPYFPGGKSNFHMKKNEFLEHENGPTEDVYLQYATYKDASDYTSLSRIWGGIHPPADDINGRIMGRKAGNFAFNKTDKLFSIEKPAVTDLSFSDSILSLQDTNQTFTVTVTYNEPMDTTMLPTVKCLVDDPFKNALIFKDHSWSNDQTLILSYDFENSSEQLTNINFHISGAQSTSSITQNPYLEKQPFTVDTKRPAVSEVKPNKTFLNDRASDSLFTISIHYDEPCDTALAPSIQFMSNSSLSATLTKDMQSSGWVKPKTYLAAYNVADLNEEISNIGLKLSGTEDWAGNSQVPFDTQNVFSINTKNPLLIDSSIKQQILNIYDYGSQALVVNLTFDRAMNTSIPPELSFSKPEISNILDYKASDSKWLNDSSCKVVYNLLNKDRTFKNIDVSLEKLRTSNGNRPTPLVMEDWFSIDTKQPSVSNLTPSSNVISDQDTGNANFEIVVTYSEAMDTSQGVVLAFKHSKNLSNSVAFNPFQSQWKNDSNFIGRFDVYDENIEMDSLELSVSQGKDWVGNPQVTFSEKNFIDLDTRNPHITKLNANTHQIKNSTSQFRLTASFDEAMDTLKHPQYTFSNNKDLLEILRENATQTLWLNDQKHQKTFKVQPGNVDQENTNVAIQNASDEASNPVADTTFEDYLAVTLTGIAKSVDRPKVFVYPNPLQSGKDLYLRVPDSDHNFTVTIHSTEGKLVYEKKVIPGNRPRLNLGQPVSSTGVYCINIRNEHYNEILKLVVTN